MQPSTYLMIAPDKSLDKLGRCIMSADLVRGLGEINPLIRAWEQFPEGVWWPGKDAADDEGGVLTCLWLGEPGGTSRKLTAFRLGPIPEFTILWDDGRIKMKGWRAIFEKVIRSGAATKVQVETKFQVNLDTDLIAGTQWCRVCRRQNKWFKTDGGKAGLCSMHDKLREMALRAKAQKSERRIS